MDDNIYIKEINTENIYKFKKISFDKIINNGYVYLKIEDNAITDLISHGEWDYPILNDTFNQLALLCKHLYAILFLSVPLFRLDLYKEKNYTMNLTLQYFFSSFNLDPNKKENEVKKPLFYSIFAYFGVYDGFSIPSYYDGFYFMKDDIIQIKLIVYAFFIIPIFAISLSLLINSFKLCFHFKFIRKDLSALENNQEIQEDDNSRKIEEFKYINLKGEICIF